MPALRDGPPWLMTEMIDAEPALAVRLLERLAAPTSAANELATAIRTAAIAGAPIVVTGCGTSEHAALGAVEILRCAMEAAGLETRPGVPISEQALEASLRPQSAGLLIGISHEGGSAATNAALAAVRGSGTTTALISAGAASPAAELADIVVATGEMDQSWCHTIGYVAPLTAAVAVGAHLAGEDVAPHDAWSVLAGGRSPEAARQADAIATHLADARTILVVASGADRPAARELVLKLEEGTWIPSAMRDLETFLHGHIPATDERTGLVVILTDRERRADRLARLLQALAAVRHVGVRTAAILAAGVDPHVPEELTPAGRIVVPEADSLRSADAALLGTATALQTLTERLARVTRTNPDPIRRDDERYRLAAEV